MHQIENVSLKTNAVSSQVWLNSWPASQIWWPVKQLLHPAISRLIVPPSPLVITLLNGAANYQLDIVRNGGLVPLAKLITSNKLPLILSAVACIRNISIHPLNETPIIDSGFLPHLVKLLDRTEDEVLSHTVITMRNVPSSLLYRLK